jgi:aspartate aminotransferase
MFDQMYFTLTYGDTRHYHPVSLRPEMKAYTVYIDGISKAFAATGVRVGWCFGPTRLISKMKSILSHIGAWSPMAEQKAVAAYLYNDTAIHTFQQKFKAELEERLWLLYKGIMALKAKGFPVDAVEPRAAIYLTVKIELQGKTTSSGMLEKQAQVTEYLLQNARLAIVPFYAFGSDHQSPWYRLSVGTCKKEEIPEVLDQLEKALQVLS